MPYKIEWLEAGHVIYLEPEGGLTESELTEMVSNIIAYHAEAAPNRVHAVINGSQLNAIPPVNAVIREMRRLDDTLKNPGMNLVFGVSPLRRYVMEIVMRMTSSRYKTFQSREETLSFVADLLQGEEVTRFLHEQDDQPAQ